MKTRRSIIPDSEDDVSMKDTSSQISLQDRLEPLSVSGSSHSKPRSTGVIKDSEDEGSDTLCLPNLLAEGQSGSPNLKVLIKVKRNVSATDSSSSSTRLASDEVTEVDTRATSVGMTAVTEPSSRPTRINASARAQQLRASRFSMRSRGTKRVADDIDSSSGAIDSSELDAALARALQEEEYDQPPPKKRKMAQRPTRSNKNPIKEPSPFEISESEVLSDLSEMDLDTLLETDYESAVAESEAIESELGEGLDEELETSKTGRRARNTNTRRRARNTAQVSDDERSGDDGLPPTVQQRKERRRFKNDRKKLERHHPIMASMWDDLKAQALIAPKQAQQPKNITRILKPFQLEGLNWMIEQEKTSFRGGLLGDEMGMGKTIQAVSLIMSDFPQPNPTLVLVPPVALMQWTSEIKDYTDGKLKVLVYHNSDSKVKNLKPADIQKYDVIMISYSSLESIYRKQEKGWSRGSAVVKADSAIHAVNYHRVILDEAHNIKQRTTSVAGACFALKAEYKWCLSGTPVQNRIGEFFSLLRFLEIRPFACYFCKQCKCQQVQWMVDKRGRCTECQHTAFNHISIFNKEILRPIMARSGTGREEAERKEGLDKLRLITRRLMLRREKKDHSSSMELPPKRVLLHNEFYGEVERDFAQSIMTNSQREFDTYVSQGVMLNNYANIFGLIMQMRQVANHPDLLLKKGCQPGQNVLVCRVCDEPAEDAIRSRCQHEFCRQCAKDYIESFEDPSLVDCPRCHIPLAIDLEQPMVGQTETVKKNSIINRIAMENWTSSTKIEMLIYDLFKQRKKGHAPKSIIFSQFTSMLQLVEWRLRHAGFNTVMLDGSMTPAQRQRSIEHFMTKVDVEIFLVSLKAGGVALNLTEASRVYIIDPWWNPAAEWQSADRCHRIGQRRPCVITRLCIEDSVESRIVQLQEKKANLIRGTINQDQGHALERLTPQDMEFLFRGG
ncbi:DNA repair protein RAD16 [Penicillium malachiteum]|uniref:DNA repair protein RAD16 n=1 Tax=Penicillium malachiteum TaxID=1324776 RepID=UPI0025487222|nr:DNA repair protein RAD16 [Penicillium malachiteum]KAJ5730126.1 DNA repair protein RAD16 [Penicillium malachiteum]